MEEAVIKRIMPHSEEAEQSVVGSMLMDKDAITTASEIISGEDFYQTAYGVVFDSVVELFNEGKPVDLITLQNRLKEKDVPEEISSLEFVRDLVAAVPTSANIKYYAEIVAEKSLLRKMIKMNDEITNACYLAKEPVAFIENIFAGLLDDTEEARQLALDFYGPIFLLYSLYDGAEEKQDILKMVEQHVDRFEKKILRTSVQK